MILMPFPQRFLMPHAALRPAAAGGGGGLLLDDYSGAAVAGSFRKMRTAYSGSAVRIRRSSDNTELDVGFSGNDFDTAAAASHIGGGSGFIVTLYDQSGNGYNLTQSNTAFQPLYTASGINSKPSMIFTGSTNTRMLSTSTDAVALDGANLAAFMVATYETTAAATYARLLSISGTTRANDFDNANSVTMARKNSTNVIASIMNDGSVVAGVGNISVSTATAYRFAWTVESTAAKAYLNGSSVDSDTLGGAQDFGNTLATIAIGGKAKAAQDYWAGNISEVVIYNSAQDANVSGINSNVGTAWGF